MSSPGRIVLATLVLTLVSGTGSGHAMADGRAPAAQDHRHEPPPDEQDRMPAPDPADHSHQQDHAGHEAAAVPERHPDIAPITDADRAAAFPDVRGHTVHDQAIHYFVLFDELELGTGAGGARWENTGWIGGDLSRVWLRTKGKGADGRLAEAQAEVLYGRPIARWWDVVAGVRQDVRPGPARTWLAVGLQGLAPYWFEIEATAYVGGDGRTAMHLETEYELQLTNRLIAQPNVGVEVYGRSDPERGIGRGLSAAEAGLRLRYEIRREIAPYVGLAWSRKLFGTADLAEAAGEPVRGTRLVAGVRVWF
jgi:copper resistance protein B